jgi:ribose/xylose/arabinose/galactoside ABC-type transport system permease subunit
MKLLPKNIGVVVKEQVLIIVLTILLLLFGVTTQQFFRIDNLLLVLRQVTIVGILSIGLTFVVIGGNLDLSISSIISLTTVVTVRMHDALGPSAAIILPWS